MCPNGRLLQQFVKISWFLAEFECCPNILQLHQVRRLLQPPDGHDLRQEEGGQGAQGSHPQVHPQTGAAAATTASSGGPIHQGHTRQNNTVGPSLILAVPHNSHGGRQ